MTFVDTNILLDIVTQDPRWAEWSLDQLDKAELRGPLLINEIVFAELSVRYETLPDCEEIVEQFSLVVAPIPRAALFLAGKAYRRYRRSGGLKTGVLPDFFVGAHAAVEGLSLVTRDPRRYLHYFPTLDVIRP